MEGIRIKRLGGRRCEVYVCIPPISKGQRKKIERLCATGYDPLPEDLRIKAERLLRNWTYIISASDARKIIALYKAHGIVYPA